MLTIEKVLVTGGAGFIGSHIIDKLLANDFEVTILDDLSTGKMSNIEKNMSRENLHFIEGDITNKKIAEKAVTDVDAIFHEAALVSVTRSVEKPLVTNNVNINGTLNLLIASLNADVQRFIYASSSSVYGDSQTLPKIETLPTKPVSPYAVSKLAAENYCHVFHEVYGLETVSLRYFNVYGPRQSYSPYSGVIIIFVNRLLNNTPPIIYGDGMQTRDFTNVKDVVQASMLSLKCKNAIGEVFNIATGKHTTINSLAEMLLKITGKTNLQPKYTDPRTGDVKHSYADIHKAERILGYKPKINIEKGLKNLVNLYKKPCGAKNFQ